MATRRMFAKSIIDSARFIRMPVSSQALYFHMGVRADDDGVVEAYNILKVTGASEDDLRVLVAKGFVTVLNDDLVTFINDWRQHNSIRADRKVESVYKDLLLQIVPEAVLIPQKQRKDGTDTGAKEDAEQPTDNQMTTDGQPYDNQMTAQVRLGKDRLGKDRSGKVSVGKEKEKKKAATTFSPTDYIREQNISEFLESKILEWLDYKKEQKKAYKETGLKSLVTQIQNKVQEYGEVAVCNLITECMANGWQGIIWDKLEKQQQKANVGGNIFYDIGKEEGLF